MPVHASSSRDFTRDVSAAKRATADGPVFITDRGRPAFTLLTIDHYYRITDHGDATLLDLMDGISGGNGIEFDPQRRDVDVGIEVDNALEISEQIEI